MTGSDARIRAFRRRLIEYGVLIRSLNDRLRAQMIEKNEMAAEAHRAQLDATILGNRVNVLENRLSSRPMLLMILVGLRHPVREEEVDARLEMVAGAVLKDGIYVVVAGGGSIELRGWLKGRPEAGGPASIRIATRTIACERVLRGDVAGTFGLDPTIAWGFSAVLPLGDVPTGESECWIVLDNRPVKLLGRICR